MPRIVPIVLALVLLAVSACAVGAAPAPSPRSEATPSPTETATTVPDGFSGGTIAIAELPPEARETLDLIDQAGPFTYDQDGAVFQNREGLLPQRSRGYYHEYTVKTPGSPDRGARRIVTGDEGERYYTDDHYDSFRLVTG